jgi:hypothetical protein
MSSSPPGPTLGTPSRPETLMSFIYIFVISPDNESECLQITIDTLIIQKWLIVYFSINFFYEVYMHILFFSELEWFSGTEIEEVEVTDITTHFVI